MTDAKYITITNRNLDIRYYEDNIDTTGMDKENTRPPTSLQPSSRTPYPPIKGLVIGKMRMCHVLSDNLSQFFFGLPLPLFKSTMANISHFPNHLSLTYRIVFIMGVTPTLSQGSSFLILYLLVFPHIHLINLISATFNF